MKGIEKAIDRAYEVGAKSVKGKISLLIEKWENAKKRTYEEISNKETMEKDMDVLKAIHLDRIRIVEDLTKLINS